MKKLAIGFIRAYQLFISPTVKLIIPTASCRYSPSCSQYTIEAIKNQGLFKGSLLGARRVFSCNPFSKQEVFHKV